MNWVLVLLTLVNLLNYLDRFILAALAPAIQADLHISDTRLGLLSSAFMFMYFGISPLFGWLGDRFQRFRLMGIGVGIWSLATMTSGLARTYGALFASRVAVGVGEASYASISPALISDLFPKNVRGRAFAIFFMAIPVGSALGYLLGGLLEHHFGWRQAFLFAGVPGVVLTLVLFFMQDPKRGAFDKIEEAASLPLLQTYKKLWGNRSYFYTVLGYAAYTFVVGGVAFWMPAYLVRFYAVDLGHANLYFGAVTVVAGFLGTIVGGFWADRWAHKSADAYLKISALSAFATAIVFVAVLLARDLWWLMAFIFVLEFLLFLSTSPINAEVVNCVPVAYRATANAVCIFAIHLFGDAVSPSLMGAISDASSLRVALILCPIGIASAGLIWLAKVIFAWDTLPWPQPWTLPKSQCHRGFHKEQQENTLAAFRAAKAAGVTMVELDVRCSQDGVAVVVHDADLKRISGHEGLVAELSAAELERLAHVPSLEAVLTDPGVPQFVNVELKSDKVFDASLERAVARAIHAAGAEGRVLFSSFNPFALRRIAKLLPAVPRGLLVTDEPDEKNKIYLRKMWLGALARPHLLHLDQNMYTESFAAELKDRGIKVALWTVQDSVKAKNFLALGAESIISDNPGIVSN